METKHTPGPWLAYKIPNDRLGRHRVLCLNDEVSPGNGKLQIAAEIRTEANARLIAAAPELFAIALLQEEANALFEAGGATAEYMMLSSKLLHQRRAAILQAMGDGA